MTTRQVVNYKLSYDAKNGTPQVTLGLQGEEEGKVRYAEIMPLNPDYLLYVTHMLRYEKPVWYNVDTQILSTGFESTGEEENAGKPKS
jgi:hypothetical protein